MSDRRVPPPKAPEPVIFRIEKDGAAREIEIPAARREECLTYGGLSIVTFDMLEKGGVMRILK